MSEQADNAQPKPRPLGMGGARGGCGPRAGVYDLLEMGSPRLALARAMGIRFTPWCPVVRADFTDPTSEVVNRTLNTKIVQDTIVEEVVFRVLNMSTANSSIFQPQADSFNNDQCGIEATMRVTGRPGYEVAPDFLQLSLLCDMLGGRKWPCGWILSWQQGIQMSFNPVIALPQENTRVEVAFRCWVPTWDELVQMTNATAIDRLRKCGIEVCDAYEDCACSPTTRQVG